MIYQFLSVASSVLVVVGYLPEIYNLSHSIIYKKAYNPYSGNIIWAIWISASGLGCIYGFCIKDYYLTVNYGINTILNATVFSLKMYKMRQITTEE